MVPLDTSEWWKTGALRHGGKDIMGAEEGHREWVAGQQVQTCSAAALQASAGSLLSTLLSSATSACQATVSLAPKRLLPVLGLLLPGRLWACSWGLHSALSELLPCLHPLPTSLLPA